jgi:hypothetical protein
MVGLGVPVHKGGESTAASFIPESLPGIVPPASASTAASFLSPLSIEGPLVSASSSASLLSPLSIGGSLESLPDAVPSVSASLSLPPSI